jgi:hypothetical protein
MTMRLATIAELPAVMTLTSAAYQPYTDLFGYPPIPVTENYEPRIERGEVCYGRLMVPWRGSRSSSAMPTT